MSKDQSNNCCCKPSYNITFHEYTLLQYQKRVDPLLVQKGIEKNAHIWTIGGKFNEFKYYEFMCNNMNEVIDFDLFDTIIAEARKIFGIDSGKPLPGPFSDDFKNAYLDYEGRHGGINLIKLNQAEIVSDFQKLYQTHPKSIYKKFNGYEKEHYDRLYEFALKDCDLSDRLIFLEKTINDNRFTPDYQSLMLFDLNNTKLYISGHIVVPPSINASNTCATDHDVIYEGGKEVYRMTYCSWVLINGQFQRCQLCM